MIYDMKNIKPVIIPLGQNCMPRTILTRWGIKKRKFLGELTFPFDFAVFGMPEITKTLKTDFNEFFNDLEYKTDYWIKAPNCIYFSHDKRYKEKDRQKLINLYTKRINNFRKTIEEKDNLLFFFFFGDNEDIENQYNALRNITKNKPFKFAIVDTENITNEINLKNVYILKLKMPNEQYKNNWWKEKYYNSPQGKAFEKQIADFCIEVITKEYV
mgnify:CR=1 FL=1